MQWYKSESNKKLLTREIEDIQHIGLVHNFRDIRKTNGNLMALGEKDFNGKSLIMIFEYPKNFPNISINFRVMQVYNPKGHTIDFKKMLVSPYLEGGHNFNGIICYQNHEPIPGKMEGGIRYVMERVDAWFEKGRLQLDDENYVAALNTGEIWYTLPQTSDIKSGMIGTFEAIPMGHKAYVINKIDFGGGNTIVPSPIPNLNLISLSEGSTAHKGIIIFANSMPELKTIPAGELLIRVPNLNTYVNPLRKGKKDGLLRFAKGGGINPPFPLLIICQNQRAHGFGIVVSEDRLDLQNYFKVSLRVNRLRIREDIFSRLDESKEQINILSTKKVGILGLGALGSTIAVELARSGVHKFVLCDKDRLDIQNIGRHDLTLNHIGYPKVKGIEDKIRSINPESDIETYEDDLKGITDNDSVFQSLMECDLLISTVDEHPARRVLNSYFVTAGKKVIYSGVFYRGVAGYAMIADKNIACLECLDLRVASKIDRKEIPDFPKMVPSIMWEQCSAPTFPGGSIKVHSISLMAAMLSIDVLLSREQKDCEGVPYNYYLLVLDKIKIGSQDFSEGFYDGKKFFFQGIKKCECCGEGN